MLWAAQYGGGLHLACGPQFADPCFISLNLHNVPLEVVTVSHITDEYCGGLVFLLILTIR